MEKNNCEDVKLNTPQNKLEKDINDLIEIVKKYSVGSILENIFFELSILSSNDDVFARTKLSSPYKQYLYLAGIRLSMNGGNQDVDDAGIKNIKELLESISMDYTTVFFEHPQCDEKSEEWRRAREVSMPLFLDYFNSDILNYEEQEVNRINIWFNKYSGYFEDKYKFSVQNLINIWSAIVEWMRLKQTEVAGAIRSTVIKSHEKFKNNIDSGMDYEGAIALGRDEILPLILNYGREFYMPTQMLYDKFNKEIIDSFLDVFCITEQTRDFRYYTQENPFSQRPLWRCSDNAFFCPVYKQLLHAIFNFLYSNLEKSPYRDSFLHHRDISTETQTKSLFRSLFPSCAKIYSSVYEKNDSHDEHDLLILYKKKIIIIEVKAGKIREPFRNPDKAYERIKGDFYSRSGIQKAYDQALKLKRYIESNESVILFDRTGNELVKINKDDYNDCFLFCITAEKYGLLGTQLSILLRKKEDESYPWVCNLYDLQTIIKTFVHKHYNWKIFLEYVRLRIKNHEIFYAFDELEICGAFLMGKINGYIKRAKRDKIDLIGFSPDMSNIFDEIYFREKGINISYQSNREDVDLRNKTSKKKKIDKRKQQKYSRKRNKR